MSSPVQIGVVDNFGIDPNAKRTSWFAECFGKGTRGKSERIANLQKKKRQEESEKRRAVIEAEMLKVTEYNNFYLDEIHKREIEIADLKEKLKHYEDGLGHMEKVVDKLKWENQLQDWKIKQSSAYNFIEGECVNYHTTQFTTPLMAKIKEVDFITKTYTLDVLMPNKVYIVHHKIQATQISKVNVVMADQAFNAQEYVQYIEHVMNHEAGERLGRNTNGCTTQHVQGEQSSATESTPNETTDIPIASEPPTQFPTILDIDTESRMMNDYTPPRISCAIM